jgi:NAD(P)-dependent dehydrogenase (short-subunit alcohol dehydrogenase family)
MKEEEWDDIINTNLSSVYKMSKAVLRGMMKKKAGRIISIASVAISSAEPKRFIGICCTKAAFCASGSTLVISVAIKPGATASVTNMCHYIENRNNA